MKRNKSNGDTLSARGALITPPPGVGAGLARVTAQKLKIYCHALWLRNLCTKSPKSAKANDKRVFFFVLF